MEHRFCSQNADRSISASPAAAAAVPSLLSLSLSLSYLSPWIKYVARCATQRRRGSATRRQSKADAVCPRGEARGGVAHASSVPSLAVFCVPSSLSFPLLSPFPLGVRLHRVGYGSEGMHPLWAPLHRRKKSAAHRSKPVLRSANKHTKQNSRAGRANKAAAGPRTQATGQSEPGVSPIFGERC